MWPLLFGGHAFEVPTYLALNSIGFSLAVYWAYRRAIKRQFPPVPVLDVSMVVMVVGFISARATHIVLEQPEIYLQDPIRIFKFWLGGFVFYGGAIGGMVGAIVYCRLKKINWKEIADIGAPVFPLGYAIGRLGCFAAGCCYGSITQVPWAVTFPFLEGGRHPTQLYLVAWESIVLICLLKWEKAFSEVVGKTFGVWVVAHAAGRMIVEQFRDDFRGPTIFNLSISTWLSVVVLIFGIWLIKGDKVKNASPNL